MNKKLKAALVSRAGNWCESCGLVREGLEVDHFFGRAKAVESLATCWLICQSCHRRKTDNEPSAKAWLWKFINHAITFEYLKEADRALGKLHALKAKGLLEAR